MCDNLLIKVFVEIFTFLFIVRVQLLFFVLIILVHDVVAVIEHRCFVFRRVVPRPHTALIGIPTFLVTPVQICELDLHAKERLRVFPLVLRMLCQAPLLILFLHS